VSSLMNLINKDVLRVLTPPDREPQWHEDLERFLKGDRKLTRDNLGEAAVEAIQRLLIFLGYSTTRRGSFAIDGDFGRGTNRGIAQYQFERGLRSALDLEVLSYDCSWQNAHTRLLEQPLPKIDLVTIRSLLTTARRNIKQQQVMCGDFGIALEHLDMLHTRRYHTCREIRYLYGDAARNAAGLVAEDSGAVHPRWILAIIKQETGGIIRPRFEQHIFSRLIRKTPDDSFTHHRFSAMSLGLGQILGLNHARVGATSPEAMYYSSMAEQVYFVARYLSGHESAANAEPGERDFRAIARFYNGPGYEKHDYHASLQRWFNEFRTLI